MAIQPIQQQNSFAQDAATCAGKRVVRDFVIAPMDRYLPVPAAAREAAQGVAALANPFTSQAMSYETVLKIDPNRLSVGKGMKFETYRQIASKEGLKDMAATVRSNFSQTGICKKLSCKEYLKKVVVAGNLESITQPLAKGLLFSVVARLGCAVLAIIKPFKKASQSYRETHSVLSAAKAFGEQSAKSLVAWEAGSVGFAVGAALLPVGALSVAAGIAGMALTSTAVSRVLDKLA